MSTFWVCAFATAIGTLFIRMSFLFVKPPKSDRIRNAILLIGPAALGALTFTHVHLVKASGEIDLPRGMAALVGGVTAYKTGSMPLTILLGMSVLWGTRAIL